MNKYCYFLILALFFVSCSQKTSKKVEVSLFRKIDTSQTHIYFKNTLSPNEKLNIIEFTYFYNGGGVAAGDFNNDGLEDLFFVSNQSENKLYLNKGDFVFEDITDIAGIENKSDWNTGVTIVDINADGYLDIYVCGVADFNGLNSVNELYINNGNLTFTESASKYGLDLQTHATQAVFFDYDHDGDLDCFLLNYALEESENYVPLIKGRTQDKLSGDYLLRNDSGKFIDVSMESGIFQSKIGFGLSVSVADFNNDGWEDIFVSNDFHEDDYFYINQKNGKFQEQGRNFFKHFSKFSMGSDAADINNDGYIDILTLDMYPENRKIEKMSVGEDSFDIFSFKLSYGYYPQYPKNALQLNNVGENFSDISFYAGIAATDWSWAPLFADFDNDGVKDLFISNGIPKRPNDLDFIDFVLNYQKRAPESISMTKYLKEAIGKMPDGSYHDFVYKGTDSLKFVDMSFQWGFEEPTVSNGAIYSDLDNDGDLDIVVNRLNDEVGIYQNQSERVEYNNYLDVSLKGDNMNIHGVGAKVTLYNNNSKQVQYLMNTRGFQSAVGNKLHFGINQTKKIDSLIVLWNTGESQVLRNLSPNQNVTLFKKDAQIVFPKKILKKQLFEKVKPYITYKHQENDFNDFNRERLMPFKISSEGPALAIGDVNQDGREDVFIGSSKDKLSELYIQESDGTFKRTEQIAFENDRILEHVDAEFFDADSDGDLDLYVVSAGNEFYDQMEEQQDCFYLNDGKGIFKKAPTNIPKMFMNTSCVKPADFDNDGDIDLFIGGRVVSNSYGLRLQSYLLINNGAGVFQEGFNLFFSDVASFGMITDAVWADIDLDDDLDLITVGEWDNINFYENKKTRFEKKRQSQSLKGLWQSISAGDFDADGDIDFLVGNLGINTKFFRNHNQNLRMYISDFDNNGSIEQILAFQENGKWYPIEGRSTLGKTLPGLIKKRFNSHEAFADKTMDEIFTKEELLKCNVLEVTTFESLYLENNGKGQFKSNKLPMDANISTVFSILPINASDKSIQFVLMAGNNYNTNTWQTPYDASNGLTLRFEENNFRSIKHSGFKLDGQVRNMKLIDILGVHYIAVVKNNDSLTFFRQNIDKVK